MIPRVVPTRRHRPLHSPAVFKRQFAILPFDLPRLSDKAAAQLLDVLHQILEGIEYHYADQIHRYRQRQHESAYTSTPTDPPF